MLVELDLPATVRPGEAVPITLRVGNPGPEAVELLLTGRPVAFDLIVSRAQGEVVWRRLHGRAIPMILQIRLLQPGEVLEFSEQWGQRDNAGRPVAPGKYRIRGVLPTENRQLTADERELVISR